MGINAGSGGSSGGLRLLSSSAGTLKYQLYSDAARTQPWGDVGSYTATTRRMVSAGRYVVYGLYQDAARSKPWGTNTGSGETLSGTGTGLTQSHTVYGRVAPQSAPPAGTYTDTVVVTVTY